MWGISRARSLSHSPRAAPCCDGDASTHRGNFEALVPFIFPESFLNIYFQGRVSLGLSTSLFGLNWLPLQHAARRGMSRSQMRVTQVAHICTAHSRRDLWLIATIEKNHLRRKESFVTRRWPGVGQSMLPATMSWQFARGLFRFTEKVPPQLARKVTGMTVKKYRDFSLGMRLAMFHDIIESQSTMPMMGGQAKLSVLMRRTSQRRKGQREDSAVKQHLDIRQSCWACLNSISPRDVQQETFA